MKDKNGFVISTTLYAIFGILLIIIFYILYLLVNNRTLLSNATNDIKNELENDIKIVVTDPIIVTHETNKQLIEYITEKKPSNGKITIVRNDTNNEVTNTNEFNVGEYELTYTIEKSSGKKKTTQVKLQVVNKTLVEAYGIENYPESISTFEIKVKQEKGIKQIKYLYAKYNESTHTIDYVKNNSKSVTVCNSEDSKTTNNCTTEVKKELDANTSSYMTDEIAGGYKYYSDDTNKHMSYILYVKDNYDNESLYQITPKIKIFSRNSYGHKNYRIYKVLADGTIIHGNNSEAALQAYINIDNVITNKKKSIEIITRPELGGFIATEDNVYYYITRYNWDDASYYKINRDSYNQTKITASEYAGVVEDSSQVYSRANKPIEHPKDIGMTIFDNYFNYISQIKTSTTASFAPFDVLKEVVFEYSNESGNKVYIVYYRKQFKEDYTQNETVELHFELKPEVIVQQVQ